MSDPHVALLMLGLFILLVFLGFPIAFTLMAMGIGFGYYAYFDARRMWRAYNRLEEDADRAAGNAARPLQPEFRLRHHLRRGHAWYTDPPRRSC